MKPALEVHWWPAPVSVGELDAFGRGKSYILQVFNIGTWRSHQLLSGDSKVTISVRSDQLLLTKPFFDFATDLRRCWEFGVFGGVESECGELAMYTHASLLGSQRHLAPPVAKVGGKTIKNGTFERVTRNNVHLKGV